MVLIPNKNPLNLVWIQGGQELWTGRVSRVISRTIDHLKGLKKKAELQSEMENDHGNRKAVTAFRPLC